MCYRPGEVSFFRPCPECGSRQCNESMFCSDCGAHMPYVELPPVSPTIYTQAPLLVSEKKEGNEGNLA